MLKDIADYLAPREEKVQFGGVTLRIRELTAADNVELTRGGDDLSYRLLICCVFLEDGTPAFTMEDVEELKKASTAKLVPLVTAMNKVNGFDIEHEAKNSDAAPS